ncbi:MAG: GNAT family N-acetyltransferase [Elusimicrobiales bacterium]|nr:GNAT family N-acetyltransferase [Elusimicrobiales bacterium]
MRVDSAKERLPKITKTAQPAKLRACARLMSACEPWLTLGRKYGDCINALRGPGKEVYIAEKSGRLAGFIVLQMCGTFKGYVQSICVAPEFRGGGYGTRLLLFAEKRVFRETPNMFLCVSSFNKRARALYRKLGYKYVGTLKDFIIAGHSELLLRKTTGPLSRHRAPDAKRSRS